MALEGLTLCLTVQSLHPFFTFSHTAHNITLLDAMGSMLLETFAEVFLSWGKKYFRIYFAMTATKYDMRYYSNKYKGVAFCHDLNETELKLCHFVIVLK